MEKREDKVSIYIPVYNEESIIEHNLRKVKAAAERHFGNYRIYVVDDSSKDRTYDICRKLSEEIGIWHLRFDNGPSRRENLGKAILSDEWADIVIFFDADLAADLDSLGELGGYIAKGYDVATGSRYAGIRPDREVSRFLISKSYNSFMRLYFQSRIMDHNCGFKAFRSDAIKDIIMDMGYDNGFSRGWFWDAEVLIRAQKKALKIKEFKVKWNRGKQTSFSFRREIRMIPNVLSLKLRLGR
jgi:glycosyltransferase AglD